jgi:hypothetical protein
MVARGIGGTNERLMDGYTHWPIVLVTISNLIFWGPTLVAAYVVLRRAGLSVWWTPLFLLYPFSLWLFGAAQMASVAAKVKLGHYPATWSLLGAKRT